MLEAIILTVITAATPLLLAAIGELVVERSGVLNLGVEGMMLMGAVAGFALTNTTGYTLAGIMEVASVIGKLQPVISPGYGFTAIIVAFLGRLNPLGILVAGFLIALTYLGGEAIQSGLQVSSKMAQVLQGMLLFYVLACDTLILYRVRLVRTPALRGEPARA